MQNDLLIDGEGRTPRNRSTQIAIGGSINNSLCIAGDAWSSVSSGSMADDGAHRKLLVCNNDETIKVFDVPAMTKSCELKMPFAVNNVQISPDGTKMLAAGDSSQVLLFDVDTSGVYTRIGTVRGGEAGFSCAWDHLSQKFAVGFQDGTVKVWDVRSVGSRNGAGPDDDALAIATLSAVQRGNRNAEACRSVKFCRQGAVDLLVFSEHVSVINLVDARTFYDKQSIRIAPSNTDANITGVAFAHDDRSVFVGLEPCVVEYDIDMVKRRSFPSAGLLL